MPSFSLKEARILLIANPAAQNGAGLEATAKAEVYLKEALGEVSENDVSERVQLALTQHAGHAAELAEAAQGFDVVLALGGDGIIHEVANGLMQQSTEVRPAMGIIPVGSGNDYARTLGMSTKVEQAIKQLLSAQLQPLDVGCCNGEYFVETLSFGLDAAIALDTMERRKRTGRTGTILYLESGLDQLFHHLDIFNYTAQMTDDSGMETAVEGAMHLFAVQIGQSYGGGFRVCPSAKPDDGLFDLCIAHPPLSVPFATMVFLLAKDGHHTRFKQLEFLRAQKLHISFDRIPPCQIDGEPLPALEYDIHMCPQALNVLVPV